MKKKKKMSTIENSINIESLKTFFLSLKCFEKKYKWKIPKFVRGVSKKKKKDINFFFFFNLKKKKIILFKFECD